MNNKKENKKWYQTNAAIITLLVVFFPVGIYLMWKHAGWNKIVKAVITGFFALLVLGQLFGSDYDNISSSNSQRSSSTSSNSQAEESDSTEDLTPQVGEVVALGQREFVVNTAERSQGFSYSTPRSGKEFVIINVTISNLGKDEVSYNPYDFKVQDANGAQEDSVAATYSLDDYLKSGTLAPSGKVTGSLVFEVEKGGSAMLIFKPNFWSSQKVVVDLGAN